MTPLLNAISLRISLIFSLFTIVILLIMGIVIHQLVCNSPQLKRTPLIKPWRQA